MKGLQVGLLITFVLILLGCGGNVAPTPTTARIALPTANRQNDVDDVPVEVTQLFTETPAADCDDPPCESAEPDSSPTLPPTSTLAAIPLPAADIPSGGRLLVIDLQNQIVTINPDSSDRRQLTDSANEIVYIFPAWSPDNQSIAAIGAGDRPATDGIYLFEDSADLPANRIHTADNQQPIYLSWSPDSENISFISPRLGGSTLLNLRVVPRSGAERSRYLAFGQPFYWDWNATGDAIIFNTNRTTHAKFAYVNLSSGDIGEEVASVAEFFQAPDLSFDDVYLAYAAGSDERNEIVIQERTTGELTKTAYQGLTTLVWSPVANQLAFINSVGQTPLPYGSVHLLDPTGEETTLIPEPVIAFFWSPDGKKIAYLTLSAQEDEPEAQRGRLAAKSRLPFFQTNRLEYQLWVTDVATSEAQLLGTFRPGNLFISQFLPFFGQYAHSHSIWSPDSSALALPVETEDGVAIYRFPINGAQPTSITAGHVAFWTRK